MVDCIKVMKHSSILIQDTKVIYFDPFEIDEGCPKADVIFVTHDHYDHYSPKDIMKIVKEDTIIYMPKCMEEITIPSFISQIRFMAFGAYEENGIQFKVIPAYNVNKQFHAKEKQYAAYIVNMNGCRYYVAGDTDVNEDNLKVECDIALVPVGGTYTMTVSEAAELVNAIRPKVAIPTHYGLIVGDSEDGKKFSALIDKGIEVVVQI